MRLNRRYVTVLMVGLLFAGSIAVGMSPAGATTEWPTSDGSSGHWVITGGATLDTDTLTGTGGALGGGSVEAAEGGEGQKAIFQPSSLSISSTGTLRITGSRVPELRVQGDVDIEGIIDISAVGRSPGPGAVSCCLGGPGGGTAPGTGVGYGVGGSGAPGTSGNAGGGSGGGGYSGGGGGAGGCPSCNGGSGGGLGGQGGMAPGGRGQGGSPGTSSQDGSSGTTSGGGGGGSIGSAASADPTIDDTLYAGSGGGGGGSNGGIGGNGGGGGGALRVVADSITMSGQIDATGGHGGTATGNASGGGGGSGGAVVLAAPTILLEDSTEIDTSGGIGSLGSGSGSGSGGHGAIGRIRLAADALTVEQGTTLWPSIGSTTELRPAFVTLFEPQISFVTDPFAAPAGTTSPLITVELLDNDGTPFEAEPGGKVLHLSSSSPTGVFRNAGNTASITSVVVPEGASTASFRYRDSDPGSPTITVRDEASGADEELVNATQQEMITPKPRLARTLTLSHTGSPHVFKGRLRSSQDKCFDEQRVLIKKVGKDLVIKTKTDEEGRYKVAHSKGGAGKYIAQAKETELNTIVCKGVRSEALTVPK